MSKETENFEELLNSSMKKINNRDKEVEGKIINISSNGEIFVDINYKADGIIPRTEYSYDINAKPEDEFKTDDYIKCQVLKWNDGEGNVLLSYKRIKQKEEKQAFAKKVDNNEIFEAKVSEKNKNGLIINYNGIRIFIPNSLSANQTDVAKFKIIEYNPKEHKIIGSCKAVIEEERKAKEEKFWNEAEEGKEYNGTVSSICSYGAFIDIDGIQGLLHISEISWDRNANANDILEQGQNIKVRIKTLDKENKRIQLSYEGKGEDPWGTFEAQVGDVVYVTIKKLVAFGAFAEVIPGVEGLIHISQICYEKIAKPDDKIKIGQKVNAKIIGLDKDNKKMELSIRDLIGTSNEFSSIENN